ncbi:MAG: putative phosphatase [Firmicutes bacterium ADurb.Bin506]|nr:MAG: putative phosphatase [Firmicutes bacterium ADurb.Bin506]
MIKLVTLDLDGTTLDSNRLISQENIHAVREARARGVVVAIATGRMHSTAVAVSAPLGSDLPIASYNGAWVRMSATGPELLRMPVPVEEGRRIVRLLSDWGLVFHAYFDDVMYAVRKSQPTSDYEAKYASVARILPDLEEFASRESMKYLVLDTEERILAIEPMIRQMAGPSLNVMRSQPGLLEIVNARASKGAALEHLAASLGISISETMAIGDSENDIDMLKAAGISVAVANASPTVKAVADHVTASNDDNGVAAAFRRFGLCGA